MHDGNGLHRAGDPGHADGMTLNRGNSFRLDRDGVANVLGKDLDVANVLDDVKLIENGV